MAKMTICDRCGRCEKVGRSWAVVTVTTSPDKIPRTHQYDMCGECLEDIYYVIEDKLGKENAKGVYVSSKSDNS